MIQTKSFVHENLQLIVLQLEKDVLREQQKRAALMLENERLKKEKSLGKQKK